MTNDRKVQIFFVESDEDAAVHVLVSPFLTFNVLPTLLSS